MSTSTRAPGSRAAAAMYVAAGGVVGAGLRWALLELLATSLQEWALVVPNALGCAVLAVVAARADERGRLGVGVGFCGGLTTFSSLAQLLAGWADDGRFAHASAYLAVSLAAGFASYLATARLVDLGGPTARSDGAVT